MQARGSLYPSRDQFVMIHVFAHQFICIHVSCAALEAFLADMLYQAQQFAKCDLKARFCLTVAKFVGRLFESRLREVCEEGSVPVARKRKRRHTTVGELLDQEADLQEDGGAKGRPAKKRRGDLKRIAMDLRLVRMYLVAHKLCWWQQESCVHIALDGARVGGRDSEVGCLYNAASDVCFWLPPVAAA